MSDPYSLFSTADISRNEYAQFLQEMNAIDVSATANHIYDASIDEGAGSFYVRLDKGEDIENRALIEYEDEQRQNLYTLLGGEPKTHMRFEVGKNHESQAVAVKFVAMIAEQYPCVVLSYINHSYYTADQLLDLRNHGLGFDGFNWKGFNAIFEPDEGDEETEEQPTDELPPPPENA